MTTYVHLKSKLDHTQVEHAFSNQLPDDTSYDLIVRGDAVVYGPDGRKIVQVVANAIPEDVWQGAKKALHGLKSKKTDNRVAYGGSVTVNDITKVDGTISNQTRGPKVSSVIIGYYDRRSRHPFCRETAFTANEVEKWKTVVPLAKVVGDVYRRTCPEHVKTNDEACAKMDPAWVIADTPFTTMTVNNTVQSGCHYDAGDMDGAMTCLSVIRMGSWTGHYLVMPEYRVAIDIQNGDVCMTDVRNCLHGNTAMVPLGGSDEPCERISVVYYMRTGMLDCGSPAEERIRAARLRGGL